MPKFRKKPVVIEAIQYPLNEWADNPYRFIGEFPAWLPKAIEEDTIYAQFESEDYWYLYIKTLEGDMRVSPGDWIIRGVQGEIYPCKPDIFEQTYEPVVPEIDMQTLDLRDPETERAFLESLREHGV